MTELFRRHREHAGSLGLLLFAAFLFAATFGAAGPVAEAAEEEANVVDVKVVEVDGNIATIIVEFGAVTDPVPSTVDLILKRSDTGKTVEGTAYVKAYEQTTAGTLVYLEVYLDDFDLSNLIPNTAASRVYVDGNVLVSVYLTFEPAPPKRSTGVGKDEPTKGTVGEIIVDPDTGRAIYAVDPDALEDLLADDDVTEVVLTLPAGVKAEAVDFKLPAKALTVLREAGKPVRVEFSGVRLVFPAQAFAGITEDVVVAIAPVEDRAEAPAPGFTAAGPVVDIEVTTSRGAVVFSQRVALALPYDEKALGKAPAWSLGVYRLNEATGEWVFVGGKVDQRAGTVSAMLPGFSRYTVMAYQKTFADIQGHWARMDIELMASKHVARGVSASAFAPDAEVTRAEFTALLVRALGIADVKPAAPRFSDVPAGHWAYSAIEAAAAAGLVEGVGGGQFAPDRRITRQEMAVLLSRAAEWTGKALAEADAQAVLAAYADAGQVAAWAEDAVAAAVKSGLMVGRTADTLAPLGAATRAESVVLIKRLLVLVGLL